MSASGANIWIKGKHLDQGQASGSGENIWMGEASELGQGSGSGIKHLDQGQASGSGVKHLDGGKSLDQRQVFGSGASIQIRDHLKCQQCAVRKKA